MPHKKDGWLNRIKAVEREHSAVRFAAQQLLATTEHKPTVLRADLNIRDLRDAIDHLEGTYVIRLFAEFETGLRLFWLAERGRVTRIQTKGLLDAIAARRHIPYDRIDHAHAVREYRNTLVHEREEPIPPIPIAVARGHLCWFFSFLPQDW